MASCKPSFKDLGVLHLPGPACVIINEAPFLKKNNLHLFAEFVDVNPRSYRSLDKIFFF